MYHRKFYDALFAPSEAAIGPLDHDTIVAIIGLILGGSVTLTTSELVARNSRS
jgi:hypothetical protein